MIRREVAIKNPTGLHLRPAGISATRQVIISAVLRFSTVTQQQMPRVCSVCWELVLSQAMSSH